MSDIESIEKFCKTRDTKYLKNLKPTYAILFQRLCVHSLSQKDVDKDIPKIVLKYYNLDVNGKRIDLKDRGRKKVEGQVNNFSVALTGARAGDVLVGASKGSKGAVMKIHQKDVPPQKRTLNGVRYYPDLWNKLLIKLGAIPFFSEMDLATREIWLDIHEADNENSIGQEGSRLELVQPGTSLFVEKLDENELDLLINGNPESNDGYWTYDEIENMIPRKAGSNAKRHTLILIRSFWKLAIDYEITTEFDDLVIDVQLGQVRKGHVAEANEEMFIIGSIAKKMVKIRNKWQRPIGAAGIQNIGLLVNKDRVKFSNVDSIINTLYPTNIEPIRHSMRDFTGAAHKSLIQKIIRFRPDKVDIGRGKLHDAQSVLLVSMCELATHPGAFVPDIQRYVTGMESFAKRVAVTIYEDSSLVENDYNMFLSLLSGALLVQRVRTWIPDEKLFISWLRAGLQGWESKKAHIIDYRGEVTTEPFVLKYDQDVLESSSAILDELRSFATDLGLARGWARDQYDPKITIAKTTPNVMHICHCVDHHWAPQVVHYFSPEFVYRVTKDEQNSSKPFGKLFSITWDYSSSINPRRVHMDFSTFENNPYVKEIRKAQKLFLVAKQDRRYERDVTDEIFEMNYTLDDAWIAGMVGAIEVKPRNYPTMLVTLASDDPLHMIVIRRPSRGMKEEPIPPEAEEMAIEMAKSLLRRGVKMDKAHAPDSTLENCRIYFVEDDEGDYYAIEKIGGKKKVPWNDVKNLRIALHTHPKMEFDVKDALIRIGTGVEENAEESFDKLVESTDANVIRRALVYLSTFSDTIEMHRISRDGGGTYQAVTLEDVPAYHFMLHLSVIYPCALTPDGPSKFKVPVGPMLWTIRDMIKKRIMDDTPKEELQNWKKVPFSDKKRTLREYQKEMTEDMIQNHKAGNKGNFIWATVGVGKTMSVLTYLQYLKENNALPLYIIYTLPESAIKSIIEEIKYFDVPINLIIPLADIRNKKEKYEGLGIKISQSCKPQPFSINLIEHDHLRRCEEELSSVAPKSIFIVDEVHKTLNDTKRTSVALQIAHLAKDFIVLTGTPVIDSNTYKLIGWLEQVVPYEVNTKNFWVAANSMIAKKVNTGVKVTTEEVIAPFTKKEEILYNSLVPPTLGGTNVKPSQKEWIAATEVCYQSANREMMKEVREFIVDGRGVMLVGKDKSHTEVLRTMLIKEQIVKDSDIFVLGTGDSIFLTDEAVNEGKVHDYKVVIVPVRKAEGYTLTRLSAMVTSVYPSNNATREQLEGRINRVSQNRSEIDYRIVHVGILTSILRNHNNAKNLSIALQGLAKEIRT